MQVGDRVRLTGQLVNPDSTWMPVETGMEPGLEGTVIHVTTHSEGLLVWASPGQIKVNWDNGRTIGLFPTDPFVVIAGEGK